MTLLKMPFFGFGQNSSTAKQTVDQQKVSAAENELDMVTDLFTRLVDVCHQKCIPSIYTDGELNKGESIGEHMQSLNILYNILISIEAHIARLIWIYCT
ncbi:hypothetical protein MERGE_001883 [Pneumocystis wakefieldiae]|uniref:Mitochondrial import inner membrane translocase subunit n=1 Tax=Pneumocystis wakefieldiae TaxID=38082 RepID=A0A899FX23_9ASCO|nr:hypothetical protein MERGE_001883 [Pneumocystis wakefieldiae]